ncbi:MAG TPA: TIGR02996 domain-containing protein [Kofleriaceae bacterium]|nr:TIGR02996 domain-containing protein [Kofleriaceae bacterium]
MLALALQLLGLTAAFYALLTPWHRRLKVDRRWLVASAPTLAVEPPRPLAPPRSPGPPPPPPPPEPPPAHDPTERELLATLAEQPADDATRAVYADFLEQRGELAKASFVRGTETLAELSQIANATVPAWRAITSNRRVACTMSDCPRRWIEFASVTSDPRERRCQRCGATIRYCANGDEARDARLRGEIVVFDGLAVLPVTTAQNTARKIPSS